MPQFQSEAADIAAADLDNFTGAYILALYWTETGDGEQPPSEAVLDDASRLRCIADCAEFQARHFNLLAEAYARGGFNYDEASAGHDFWLSRGGHGAGYWDRQCLSEGGLGDRLTEAARAFGEVTVTGERDHALSNDWILYVEGGQ